MHDMVENLYELCETVEDELKKSNEKIRKAGGELTSGDVDYLDKLTHMLKSIKTTVAMLEYDNDGYSNRYDGGMSYARDGRSGNRGGNRGNSYARGRTGNVRRDSMGRYSRDGGYSYADGMEELLGEMRDMMGDMPADKQREIQRFIQKMEQM